VPQRFDRVEAGGAAGGVVAEEDPDRGRERDSDRDCVPRDPRRPFDEIRDRARPADAQGDPSRPPAIPRTTASARNCRSTSRARAPTAMRSPISRVRSVTDTSMMFMIPTPPTSSETEATLASSTSIVLADAAIASAISVGCRMLKSSGVPSRMW
jgi:hypothetical protein